MGSDESHGRACGRKPYVVVALVSLLLFVPSIWGGFLLDDFYYLGAIEGRYPDHDTGKSLFTYFVNDEAETERLAAEGRYPWWIDDERIRSQIFRPLSDLLLRADHLLFGRWAPGYHLHSLLWWAATLLACGLVYRRALPVAPALIAFLLFAIDDVHVMPIAWIANRNALVAAAPVLFGLWALIRWREDHWRPGVALALAAFAVAMAGSELSLAALAYVAAYELLGGPARGLRSRVTGLAPLAALGAVYFTVYKLLGYGGEGSGVYFHPLHDPVDYLTAAVTRVPTLMAGAIASITADLWFAAPQARPLQVAAGCAAILILAALLRICWPGFEPEAKRALRWLLPGSLLSFLPIVATFPSDRMLLAPGIGLAAALGAVFAAAYAAWRARRRKALTAVCAALALGHFILAPVYAVWIQTLLISQGKETLQLAGSPLVRECAGVETVVIYAPDHVASVYMPVLIEHLGGPAPKGWRPLSIARCDHKLKRTGPRTLEIETVDGGRMMESIFELLYRSPKNALEPGDVLDRGLFRAEILEGDGVGLTRIAFHFDRDLTDPGLRFLVWEDGALREASPPNVGEEIYIERTLGPAGF
jgi:hypothetical protein